MGEGDSELISKWVLVGCRIMLRLLLCVGKLKVNWWMLLPGKLLLMLGVIVVWLGQAAELVRLAYWVRVVIIVATWWGLIKDSLIGCVEGRGIGCKKCRVGRAICSLTSKELWNTRAQSCRWRRRCWRRWFDWASCDRKCRKRAIWQWREVCQRVGCSDHRWVVYNLLASSIKTHASRGLVEVVCIWNGHN